MEDKKKRHGEEREDVKEAEETSVPENEEPVPETVKTEEDKLREELENAKKQAEEYKDKWMRNVAEFDNYKKRNAKLWQDAYNEGISGVVLKILPVGDNLERALMMGLDEKTEKEYLKIIEEESARLANMATKVLNMTKIENTAILTNKTRFDLSEDIRTTFLLLEKKWTEKNLTPVLEFDEVFCWGDRDLLKEAWLNLTENAIKFANPGTDLTVKIERDAHSVKVSFTDVGAVIPREEIPRIFGKFYQADKSHKTQGNGIGLSMVKKIAELHFGKVDVISDLSATTFTVTLRQ